MTNQRASWPTRGWSGGQDLRLRDLLISRSYIRNTQVLSTLLRLVYTELFSDFNLALRKRAVELGPRINRSASKVAEHLSYKESKGLNFGDHLRKSDS